MANRTYLYSSNKSLAKRRDLSEINGEIPLIYKILLGVDTELIKSYIFNYDYPIAYLGNLTKV